MFDVEQSFKVARHTSSFVRLSQTSNAMPIARRYEDLDIDAAMLGPTQTHALRLSLVEASTSPHKIEDVPQLGDWKPGSGTPHDVGSRPRSQQHERPSGSCNNQVTWIDAARFSSST